MKPRLPYVDIVKGFGIILVLLSHSVYPDLMYWANGFFMPLFYVSSGYTDKTENVSAVLVWKKLKRLLIPYLFFNIALLAYYSHWSLLDILGVLYSRIGLYLKRPEENIMFFSSGNQPMWFLTSLFTSFLMYYVLLMVKTERKRMALAVVFLIASFLARYLPILLPWSLDVAMVGALYIYVGRMMRKYDVLNHIKPLYALLLLFCTYMVVHYINGMENMSMRVYGRLLFFSVYCGVAGSCCLFWFSKAIQNTRVGGGISWIGQNSLVLFCVQIPFIEITEKTMLANGINELWIVAIVQTIVTLIAGSIISILIKKFFPQVLG